MGEVIATTTEIVHDEAMGFDRQVVAGQKIPADLVEPYKKAGGKVADVTAVPSGARVADAVGSDSTDVASQSIKDILADVGDDKDEARHVLELEQARGDDARSSLVEALEKIVDAGE